MNREGRAFVVVALITFLLPGCSGYETEEWKLAPSQRQCTEQEMARVERETSWCSENAGYIRSYCYGTAILRNCSALVEPKKP